MAETRNTENNLDNQDLNNQDQNQSPKNEKPRGADAGDTHTGRYQTTTIKGENPEQTQSPNVGANQGLESQQLDATYGKNQSNLGSRMGDNMQRGTQGLTSETPLQNNPQGKADQSLNDTAQQGDKNAPEGE